MPDTQFLGKLKHDFPTSVRQKICGKDCSKRYVMTQVGWYWWFDAVKTRPETIPEITIFIGGMVTIPSHGWFMTLFFHVFPTLLIVCCH